MAIGARGVSDSGRQINLDVLVALDGISTARGRDVMAMAAKAYAPVGINLRCTFQKWAFASGDVDKLFDKLITKVGGVRPRGSDLVYLLTDKDIYFVENGENSYDVAGVAYCIGGVRYRDAAFAIGEGTSPWESVLRDYTFSAKIAAHEIGHVMGAHHHYGNCVEGDGSTEGGGEPSVCTVMWPTTVDLSSFRFGALEAAVIRGHAARFASP